MALIKVPYETAEELGVVLELEVPDQNLTTYEAQEPPALADPIASMLQALENPVGGKKLSQLLTQGCKVCIITENQFRAAQAKLFLPTLLDMVEAAGGTASIAIGCGKVPALSPEEIADKLGPEVMSKGVAVECNDVSQPDNYVYMGTTSAGTPLWVLKSVAEADVIITISTTQATLWGYGGSGMIIPAVSGNDTIEINHVMSMAPDCLPGNNYCRMQQDKYEALDMVGVDVGINVVVANNWDIIYVNAGDPVESHMAAVSYYDGIYKFVPVEQPDIVIAGSTAPTNHLFFHTNWAIVNVLPLTHDDSSIIFCSPCPGYGDWPGFALMDLMQEYMPATEENHVKALTALVKGERELWAGCIWYPLYRALMQRDVQVVTMQENLEMAKGVGLNVSASLQEAFDAAMEKHGPDAKVAFVPYGRYTVFPS